jgi:hypothetical protein
MPASGMESGHLPEMLIKQNAFTRVKLARSRIKLEGIILNGIKEVNFLKDELFYRDHNVNSGKFKLFRHPAKG